MRARFALASLLAACAAERPATALLVEVQSDLQVGSELTDLWIEVFDVTGTDPLSAHPLALTHQPGDPTRYTLPASFALTPADEGAAFPLRVVVTGRGPQDGRDVELVRRQELTAFVSGRELRVPVFLGRSCVGMLCAGADGARGDTTCMEGACVPLPAPPAQRTEALAIELEP